MQHKFQIQTKDKLCNITKSYFPLIQELKTWPIDFQKTSILDLTSSPLMVSGDIKVELTQKSSRKMICSFWVNTFFMQNDAGM